MSRLKEFQDRHRDLPVPDSVVAALEEAVMDRLPAEHFRSRRTARRIVTLTLLVLAMLVVVKVFFHSEPHASRASTSTESVMILDDHICIWLEPANQAAKGEQPQ
jgi:hypothetical protein